jgi:GNAT superfamily N-acetyltransferase
MTLTTRLATPEDATAIAVAHVRAWQVAYEGIVPASYLLGIDVDERTKTWESILSGEVAVEGMRAPTDVVAVKDGRVVGFANVGPFRRAPSDATAGEIWAIYVHPDHWGTGAGAALMQEAVAEFARQTVTRGYLWVLEDNALARAFYERFGWRANDAFETLEIDAEELREIRYSIHLT